MSLLGMTGVVIGAYLAAGRTGSVAACLVLGVSPWTTLIVALVMDFIQIPVYGLLMELSSRHMPLPERVRGWGERKARKLRERLDRQRNLLKYRPLSVIVVSSVPMRGFGVLSACILASLFGYSRTSGTLLIMAGSFTGASLSVLIFFWPARWIHGF